MAIRQIQPMPTPITACLPWTQIAARIRTHPARIAARISINSTTTGSVSPAQQVLGIEVKMDAKADSTSGAPKLCIQLSWNAGASWTTAKQTGTLTTTEQTYTLGSPSDNWGHTWTLSQLSNSNFRVRIIDVATSTSRDFSLDWITVRVTYQ